MHARKVFRGIMIFLLTAALTALSLGAFAQVTPPARVNYQGVLRDASGNPLSGSQTMTFRFYDAASVGTLLWEELFDPSVHPPQVTVTSGLFTVALGDPVHRNAGSEAAFSNVFALHAAVYLAVKVGADAEMTPRIQAVATPFAENADTLDGKHASSFVDASTAGSFLNTSSTPQTKAGKLTLTGATDYGIVVYGPLMGGHFEDLDNSGYANVGIGDYGIQAAGGLMGGHFRDSDSSGIAYAGYGDTGIDAYGSVAGGYFHGPLSGYANVGYGNYGIDAYGNTAGGYFKDRDNSGYAYVGYGEYGISALGNNVGGYFKDIDASGYAYVGIGHYGIWGFGNTAGGSFLDKDGSGAADVGIGDAGINARGNSLGGIFQDMDNTGLAYLAFGDRGIWAKGTFGGGTFSHPDNVTFWADVATPTYKIYGTGAVSFVQNHPGDANKVIVYAAPEGDEVATYTRGTAHLVKGEARVKLGVTFAWVTNPELGLTAHLTPKGDCNGLYAESVSTAEIVVRELNHGRSNTTFDYIVYGLRIGFEEAAIVQPKEREALLPSDQAFSALYGGQSQLGVFSARERFQAMEVADPTSIPKAAGTMGADALKAAIQTAGYQGIGKAVPGEVPASLRPPQPPGPPAAPPAPAHPGEFEGVQTAPPLPGRPDLPPAEDSPEVAPPVANPVQPCFPVSGSVQAGDILVMDPLYTGNLIRCSTIADPLVVGIAMGSREDCLTQRQSGEAPSAARVPIATSGIVSCKVDAGFAPIRRGDLLVASLLQGHAMRADHPAQGTVIGKALESLESGTGLIKVLIMLR